MHEGMSAKRMIIIAAGAMALLAAVCIMAIGPRQPRPLVIDGKSVEVWSIEANAGNSNAIAIIKRAGAQAVPNLIWQLGRKESFLFRKAWQIKPKLPAMFQTMIVKQFGAPHPQWISAREAAANSLGFLGPEAKPAVHELTKALQDREGNAGWKAAGALAGVGPEALPGLVRSLNDRNPDVRWRAAYALGEMKPGPSQAVRNLVRATSDSQERVRNSAVYSLTQIGTPALLGLSELVRSGTATEHDTANRVLDAFERVKPNSVASLLVEATGTDSSPAARVKAIEAIGTLRLGNPSTRRCLMDRLSDPDREVRLASARVLGTMGKRARAAEPALIILARDADAEVRTVAHGALAQIRADREQSNPVGEQ